MHFLISGTFGYNIKYQKDIGWVRQNTTLYYGVGCPKGTTCFGPLL